MKTVGVLGGIGPQATMDFEARFHQAVQRHSQIPSGNHGYPPLVVWYHRRPPVVVGEDMLPRIPIQPDPALLEGAAFLGRVADFLVITANGPHAIQAEIEAAAGKPVLSMIALALEALARRGWRRVGVLGLGEPRVYTGPLAARNVPFETIDGDLRAKLDAGILRLMAGRESADDAAAALEAVDDLRGRGVDGVILGCTELPLLLGGAGEAADLLNPGALLAEEAALHALRD
jgi:aspartate racemase